MSKSRKILILTATKALKWSSMSEVLPILVETWQELENFGHKIKSVSIENVDLKAIATDILWADEFVFTSFSPEIGKIARFIRRGLHHEGRFIFHLHNMASLGCWPLIKWGPADIMTNQDIFIATSKRDLFAINQVFSNAKVHLSPYTFKEPLPIHRGNSLNKTPPFIFAGRISEQKNIHTLFWAFSLLKKEYPKEDFELLIFGEEDNLGSPCMGKESGNYKDYLIELSRKLDIYKEVQLKGLLPRKKLNQFLEEENHIFICPSLHADENFGMSAFKSLCLGRKVILTNWGGHHDFAMAFQSQVLSINVQMSIKGPSVSPFDLLDAMKNSISRTEIQEDFIFPYSFSRSHILKKINEEVMKVPLSTQKKEKLIVKPLLKKILDRQDFFSKSSKNLPLEKQGCQIFDNFYDPLARLVFSWYSGNAQETKESYRDHVIAPWVEDDGDRWIIFDPHRGNEVITKGVYPEKELLDRGYAFEVNS